MDFTVIFQNVFSEYGLLVTGMGSLIVYLFKEKTKSQDKYEELLRLCIEGLNTSSASIDKLTDRLNRNG